MPGAASASARADGKSCSEATTNKPGEKRVLLGGSSSEEASDAQMQNLLRNQEELDQAGRDYMSGKIKTTRFLQIEEKATKNKEDFLRKTASNNSNNNSAKPPLLSQSEIYTKKAESDTEKNKKQGVEKRVKFLLSSENETTVDKTYANMSIAHAAGKLKTEKVLQYSAAHFKKSKKCGGKNAAAQVAEKLLKQGLEEDWRGTEGKGNCLFLATARQLWPTASAAEIKDLAAKLRWVCWKMLCLNPKYYSDAIVNAAIGGGKVLEDYPRAEK
ncbi:unnamed protein product [Amoebophrya sp. A120]|nr:unnamed protein product [Amoebophrya sp. A120]|eukprot:GSA120T00013108001.1